jgi:Tol biopolymer transport system component
MGKSDLMKQIEETVLSALGLLLSLVVWSCENVQQPDDPNLTDDYLHVRAAWSPDGTTIAFSSLASNATGIYLVDANGGNLRNILSGDGLGVTWSPDGRWLAFTNAGYLHKMRPNGDSLTRLGDFYGAIRPSWSGDSSKIAFVPRDAGEGLWLYDLKADTATQLLAYGNYPSWHPTTGEVIGLNAQYNVSSGVILYSFLAVSPSTRAVRVISSFTTISECGFSRISPDGKSILFSLRRPDDHVQVWLFDINLVQHKQLTTEGGDLAAWSPDGSKIVFTRTQPGDGTLWVMNADGSNKRQLTRH